jgi:hypothetical protein
MSLPCLIGIILWWNSQIQEIFIHWFSWMEWHVHLDLHMKMVTVIGCIRGPHDIWVVRKVCLRLYFVQFNASGVARGQPPLTSNDASPFVLPHNHLTCP